MSKDEDRTKELPEAVAAAIPASKNDETYDVESTTLFAKPEDETTPLNRYWGRFSYPQATARPITAAEDEENVVPITVAQWDDREVRHGFLRKVYLILAAQMVVTFGVCALMSLHEPTQQYVLNYGMPWYWVSVVVLFAVICALHVYKRQFPANVILLAIFTLAMSYVLGLITAMFTAAGASGIILEAVFLTATVFLALTIFTLQSKWDFSFMGAGLGMCLWILVLWSFLSLFFGFETGYVYALIGSVLFSGYIIFDTYMLAERLDPADYVICAIELYLDIVNLFLMILRLLSDSNNNS